MRAPRPGMLKSRHVWHIQPVAWVMGITPHRHEREAPGEHVVFRAGCPHSHPAAPLRPHPALTGTAITCSPAPARKRAAIRTTPARWPTGCGSPPQLLEDDMQPVPMDVVRDLDYPHRDPGRGHVAPLRVHGPIEFHDVPVLVPIGRVLTPAPSAHRRPAPHLGLRPWHIRPLGPLHGPGRPLPLPTRMLALIGPGIPARLATAPLPPASRRELARARLQGAFHLPTRFRVNVGTNSGGTSPCATGPKSSDSTIRVTTPPPRSMSSGISSTCMIRASLGNVEAISYPASIWCPFNISLRNAIETRTRHTRRSSLWPSSVT